VADEREAAGPLRLVTGEPGGRVQDPAELFPLGQLARFRGDGAGDRLQLIPAGQVVLQDDELLLQLDRHLDDRRQDDDERPGLLAHVDPGVEGLDDLGAPQEAVEVDEDQQRRAVGRGHGVQGPDRRQRVGGVDGGGDLGPSAEGFEAPVDVPGGQRPTSTAAQGGDLGQGVLVLGRPDPQAGEAGTHVLLEALGERHGGLLVNGGGWWLRAWRGIFGGELRWTDPAAALPAGPGGIRP